MVGLMYQDRFSCKACISTRAKVKDLESGEKMADATRHDSHWAIFIDQSDWRTSSILPNVFSKYKHLGTIRVFIHCVTLINIF